MSLKIYDGQGRWRNKTVAFRMSPEEAEHLNILARLSGLSKQEYLIHRVLVKEITVFPNSRIFKALRDRMDEILAELRRLNEIRPENEELLDLIFHITTMLQGMSSKEQ
ncbi:hypothetical protein LJC42_08870 [Eubacteriales bacterium OttesenSCG-928-K08]|nr:hypothetical protein [Eubacteriales bacterium OttesenSCG-928-K08]